MRPLLRNALWLGFALACGGAGYWQGVGKGAEIISGMSASMQRDDAFDDIRRALPIIAQEPQGALADYAKGNLRRAIYRLGTLSFDHGWRCTPRDRAQLGRAAAWLATRANNPSDARDPIFKRGLSACER